MAQKQTKRAEKGIEPLVCTYRACKELQDENEFCFKHSFYPIRTKEEARNFAIEWQLWQAEQKMFMSEMAEWGNILTKLAKKYHLVREFKENGII